MPDDAPPERLSKTPSKRALAFKRWVARHGTSTKRVAREAAVPYTTLASFVQGDTQSLKGENEELIARACGSSVEEIFGGEEPTSRAIPIISSVAAGALADPNIQIPAETQTIEISGLPPGEYFATRVAGTSMNRLSPEGSLIIVNRAERDPIRGKRYIFGRRGKTTYKKFETDPLRLEPETTLPEENPTIYPKSDEEWTVIGRVRLTLMDDL